MRIRQLVGNLYDAVRDAAAAGLGAVVATSVAVSGALTAATVNGLAITTGTDTSGTPASIVYGSLGSFYVGVGSGAPSSWGPPGVGSLYLNSATGLLYYKWGASATNWIQLFGQASALSATTGLFTGFVQTTNFIQMGEIAAPASGGADTARLFLDNGGAGGKTRLMIVFQSGAAVVVALEA